MQTAAPFETVIGLEVHAELATKSKIFCSCSTAFGAPPNTHTCPICLGHPGVLPVVNRQAVEYAMKAALALNCTISKQSKFDRKNYFYPDLPKAYQTSQYDQPIGLNGWIEIEVQGEKKRIGITRVHLEEDAGKLTHSEGSYASLIDFNRVGVPLIEIVSEPDLRSPEEARAYMEKLRAILLYTGVSDVKMEEGSMRCDANVSLRPRGTQTLGTKAEVKNMNSFRSVQRALEYEVERQSQLLSRGAQVLQETRRWNEEREETTSMRSKEEAHDYRYFPEPDLVLMELDEAWQERVRQSIPELPDDRVERYQREYGLPRYDAEVLTATREMADFFEEAVTYAADAKTVANWMMGDLMGYLNANGLEVRQTALTASGLGEMIRLIEQGTISGKIAKTVFREMVERGGRPEEIVQAKGLVQISDSSELEGMVQEVIASNPQSVEDYRAGKEKAIGFLVGQVMKASRGKANPQMVNDLLKRMLQG